METFRAALPGDAQRGACLFIIASGLINHLNRNLILQPTATSATRLLAPLLFLVAVLLPSHLVRNRASRVYDSK